MTTAEWIDEGVRQFTLALLLGRYLHALSQRWPASPYPAGNKARSSRDQANEVVEAIRVKVLERWLSVEWLPSARDIFASLPHEPWYDAISVGRLPAVVERFRRKCRDVFALRREVPRGTAPTAPDPNILKDLIVWALRAAAGEINDLPRSAANLPPLQTVPCTAQMQASAWLAQGAALGAWAELAPLLDRQDAAEMNLARVPRLARDCHEIEIWLNEWSTGKLAFGPFLAGVGPLAQSLRKAARELEDCAKSLGKLQAAVQSWPPTGEMALRQRRELLRQIRLMVDQAKQSWPLRILVKAGEELGALGFPSILADVADSSLPRVDVDQASPGELMVLALGDRLAWAGIGTDDPAWDVLESHATRLVAPEDSGDLVSLIRGVDPARDAGAVRSDPILAEGQPPRLREVGLLIRRGNQSRVVRQGCLETSRPRPKEALLFRQLGQALARGNPGQHELAGLFARVALDLLKHGDLSAWWSAALRAVNAQSLESLGQFWQAVQRAAALTCEPGPIAAAAADLLKELSATFSFVPPKADGRPAGVWLLASDGTAREATPLSGTPTLALRGPDGFVLEPAGWLKVPIPWPSASPLVRHLLNAQPLIIGLHAVDPGWEGWSGIGKFAWDMAYRGSGGTPGIPEPERVRTTFEQAYRRGHSENDPLSQPFRELARRLYAGLIEAGMSIVPQLDPRTLEPLKLETSLSAGTVVRWVQADRRAGSIVEVVRFGTDGAPGEVKLSVDPNVSKEMLPWVEMMNVAAAQPSGTIQEPPAVRAWLEQLPHLLHQQEKAIEVVKKRKKEFLTWARSDSGREEFHRLVQQAEGNAAVPAVQFARVLRDTLVRGEWCHIYPDTDPKTGRAIWPKGLSTAVTDVEWNEYSDVPFGQARPGEFRYSALPELIGGTFSLGVPSAGTSLGEILRVWRATSGNPEIRKRVKEPVTNLLVSEIDDKLGVPSTAGLREWVGPMLQALMSARRDQPKATGVLDTMLDAARGWASTRGLTIRPLRWSFASPPTAEELALEEPPMLPAPSFTAETDVGSIELQELGWSGEDGTLLHAPRLIYSVGRAPTHYEELRAHLASVPSWPGAPRLLSELDKWPQRQVESSDSLRFSAEHFFDRFWEAVGDRPLPPEVQDCADMLSRLLRENLGSDIFLPSSTKDYRREWVKVRNRGPFNTGRVTRIIRPGLCRSADSLIFPAVVDVE